MYNNFTLFIIFFFFTLVPIFEFLPLTAYRQKHNWKDIIWWTKSEEIPWSYFVCNITAFLYSFLSFSSINVIDCKHLKQWESYLELLNIRSISLILQIEYYFVSRKWTIFITYDLFFGNGPSGWHGPLEIIKILSDVFNLFVKKNFVIRKIF